MSSYAGIPARHFLMPVCFTLLDVEVAPLLDVKVARPRLHLRPVLEHSDHSDRRSCLSRRDGRRQVRTSRRHGLLTGGPRVPGLSTSPRELSPPQPSAARRPAAAPRLKEAAGPCLQIRSVVWGCQGGTRKGTGGTTQGGRWRTTRLGMGVGRARARLARADPGEARWKPVGSAVRDPGEARRLRGASRGSSRARETSNVEETRRSIPAVTAPGGVRAFAHRSMRSLGTWNEAESRREESWRLLRRVRGRPFIIMIVRHQVMVS